MTHPASAQGFSPRPNDVHDRLIFIPAEKSGHSFAGTGIRRLITKIVTLDEH